MHTLLHEITTTFKQDDRLVIDGKLPKNRVVELALKLDKDLLKLLLGNTKLKKRFFVDVDGTVVFDKQFFQKFVANKQFYRLSLRWRCQQVFLMSSNIARCATLLTGAPSELIKRENF